MGVSILIYNEVKGVTENKKCRRLILSFACVQNNEEDAVVSAVEYVSPQFL